MKRLSIITLLVITFTGCKKLTDVLNQDPPNNLVPENVAATAEGARNLLNGTYAMLHDQYYYMYTETTPAVMSGTMQRNGFLINQQFQDNAVTSDHNDVNNYWTAFYKMINQANWVIQLVGELPEGELSQTEQNEILGQAMALRAMAHFDALRYFGQFYDLNSNLGIIIRTEPANFTTRSADRNTVAEVYDQVLSDLDFAIANAPDLSKPIFFSNTAAKALKARVLLYMGNYAEAASLADEVITDGAATLSATFSKVFSDGFNPGEMLFMRATDEVTVTSDRKRFTYGSRYAIASTWLKTLMTGDPRAADTYAASNSAIVKVHNTTFFSPTYFIRLAEMYLIKAEGLARIDAPLADAKAPLEAIQSRAWGAPQVSPATNKDELLDEIYEEIIKELCFENGSDWFAGIRFDKIMTVKPTVTDVNQYILPIPDAEILANGLLNQQNPGY